MNGYTSLVSIDATHSAYAILKVGSVHGFQANDLILLLNSNEYELLRIYTVDTTEKQLITSAVLKTFTLGDEISLLTPTRELLQLHNDENLELSVEARGETMYRYPYKPESWTGISHMGLLLESTRSDVKTFSSNVTVEWDAVLQDCVITETFANMEYNFFHALYRRYMQRVHFLYRPRDLNLNDYEVEIVEVKPGKQHQFWVDNVSVKYKVHKERRIVGMPVDLYNENMRAKIFPRRIDDIIADSE